MRHSNGRSGGLTLAALSQSGRKVLRGRGHARARLLALAQHHIPRPEAREPAPRSARPPQDHRLWIREGGTRHHMDALRNARLPRARSGRIEGIQQVGRLVGLKQPIIMNACLRTQVVTRHSHLRDAVRFHALLGRRFTHEDLRKHPQVTGQVSAIHPP